MRRLSKEDALDIVKEMFKFIGVEFVREEVEHDSEWYTRHPWSEDEQEQFRKWLVKHLRTKFKQPKSYAESGARWFVFCYGFTTKQPEEKDATT